MATQTLVDYKRGIDRSRPQATAKQGTFWDLVNCYVTPGGIIEKRPGFRHVAKLDSATKGLFANGGSLRTFYGSGDLEPPAGVNIKYHALRNGDDEAVLSRVYSDHLFLGKQYVVVEFEGGEVEHFWLQNPKAWAANTVYDVNDLVQPSEPNGYYYRAESDDPPPSWRREAKYALGDVVQPTTYNGWKYTVVEVAGDNPVSGTVEPDWPESDGAQVVEFVDETAEGVTFPEPPPVSDGGDRYGNLPGGSFNKRLTGVDEVS